MYDWLTGGNNKFWLILNFSKVVWDIDTKFLPVVVLMSFQLPAKFGDSRCTQNWFPPKTILNFKRAWRAHFLSHTHETQEICFFFGDVQIISLSFFDLSYCLKVAKNTEAFLSRCSELLGLFKFLNVSLFFTVKFQTLEFIHSILFYFILFYQWCIMIWNR